MHAQYAFFLWQPVVKDGENTFFHLAGIACSTNQDDAFGEIDHGEVLIASIIHSRICLEARGIDDEPVGVHGFDLFCCWAHKHVIAEHISPRVFVDHTDIDAVFRVGASVIVAHPNVFIAQISQYLGIQLIESGIIGWDVEVVPVNRIGSFLILYGEFVFWRSSAELACINYECATIGHYTHATLKGMLHQFGRAEIPEGVTGVIQAYSRKGRCGVLYS